MALKPKSKDYREVVYQPEQAMLHRLFGQCAFLFLDDVALTILIEAVAKNRKSTFMERVDAGDREKGAMETFLKTLEPKKGKR